MRAALRSAVESIQPGDSHANFGELARAVRAMAETVHTPMELHLFSDMQKTAMPANFADMVMPANVTVVLHPWDRAARRTGRSKASMLRRSWDPRIRRSRACWR